MADAPLAHAAAGGVDPLAAWEASIQAATVPPQQPGAQFMGALPPLSGLHAAAIEPGCRTMARGSPTAARGTGRAFGKKRRAFEEDSEDDLHPLPALPITTDSITGPVRQTSQHRLREPAAVAGSQPTAASAAASTQHQSHASEVHGRAGSIGMLFPLLGGRAKRGNEAMKGHEGPLGPQEAEAAAAILFGAGPPPPHLPPQLQQLTVRNDGTQAANTGRSAVGVFPSEEEGEAASVQSTGQPVPAGRTAGLENEIGLLSPSDDADGEEKVPSVEEEEDEDWDAEIAREEAMYEQHGFGATGGAGEAGPSPPSPLAGVSALQAAVAAAGGARSPAAAGAGGGGGHGGPSQAQQAMLAALRQLLAGVEGHGIGLSTGGATIGSVPVSAATGAGDGGATAASSREPRERSLLEVLTLPLVEDEDALLPTQLHPLPKPPLPLGGPGVSNAVTALLYDDPPVPPPQPLQQQQQKAATSAAGTGTVTAQPPPRRHGHGRSEAACATDNAAIAPGSAAASASSSAAGRAAGSRHHGRVQSMMAVPTGPAAAAAAAAAGLTGPSSQGKQLDETHSGSLPQPLQQQQQPRQSAAPPEPPVPGPHTSASAFLMWLTRLGSRGLQVSRASDKDQMPRLLTAERVEIAADTVDCVASPPGPAPDESEVVPAQQRLEIKIDAIGDVSFCNEIAGNGTARRLVNGGANYLDGCMRISSSGISGSQTPSNAFGNTQQKLRLLPFPHATAFDCRDASTATGASAGTHPVIQLLQSALSFLSLEPRLLATPASSAVPTTTASAPPSMATAADSVTPPTAFSMTCLLSLPSAAASSDGGLLSDFALLDSHQVAAAVRSLDAASADLPSLSELQLAYEASVGQMNENAGVGVGGTGQPGGFEPLFTSPTCAY